MITTTRPAALLFETIWRSWAGRFMSAPKFFTRHDRVSALEQIVHSWPRRVHALASVQYTLRDGNVIYRAGR